MLASQMSILRVFGLPEAEISAVVRAAEAEGCPGLRLLERDGEFAVCLQVSAPTQAMADEYCEKWTQKLRARLGDAVYGTGKPAWPGPRWKRCSKSGGCLSRRMKRPAGCLARCCNRLNTAKQPMISVPIPGRMPPWPASLSPRRRSCKSSRAMCCRPPRPARRFHSARRKPIMRSSTCRPPLARPRLCCCAISVGAGGRGRPRPA